MQDLLDSLKLDPRVLLFNGVLFLILLAILDRLFWKPVMRHLDKRRENIAAAYKSVEDARAEMENLRAEYQSRLAHIEAEARARIQQTVRDAQAQRERMIAQARAQAEAIVQEGAQSIAQETERAIAGMREQLDDVAANALAKAIGAPVNEAQRRLIDEYIAQNVLRS